MSEPLLTVVTVSYNTRDLLAACLASLRCSAERAPEVPMRVVVVDNGSVDGSAEMVRDRFPEVELRALDRNVGFSAGNNVGLHDASTAYVLLLNPDTEVVGDAPAALVRFLRKHPRAGAAGGRLIYPDGSFQHSAFRFPTLTMSFLDFFPINHRLTDSRLNGRYPRASYDHPFQIDHPLGACIAIKREVLDQIGLLDEGFALYCEELDLCRRIKNAGWEVWYTPDATVVHHGAASTRQFRGESLVRLHRSRYRFFDKFYAPWFSRAARGIVGLGVLRDIARDAWSHVRGDLSANEWRERRGVYSRLLAL